MQLFWRIQDEPDLRNVQPLGVGFGTFEFDTDAEMPQWMLPHWRGRFRPVRPSFAGNDHAPVFPSIPLPYLAPEDADPADRSTPIFLPVLSGLVDPVQVRDALYEILERERTLEGRFVVLCAGIPVGFSYDPVMPGPVYGPVQLLKSWTAAEWFDWYRRFYRPFSRQVGSVARV